jgi:L-tartrate/succinate antiporter
MATLKESIVGDSARAGDWGIFARAAIPLLVCAAIALAPVPEGLSGNAWHYFALFAGVMVGIMTEPIPQAAVGLLGIVAAAVSGVVHESAEESARWALSGFSNSTVWLIFAAFVFALGYSESGLGRRIALLLIRLLGKRTLGLGYAVSLADLALAPVMPSNTARSGGTIYPVIRNIPEIYGSHAHDASARKIGSYLLYTALAATCVTSSMFLTALAANVLAVGLVSATVGVTITWTVWFKAFAPAGVVLFALTPALLYKIYPPEIKESPDAPRWAAAELAKLGPVTRNEKTLLVLVTAALAMWIAGGRYADATITAILAGVLMVILGIVRWEDILANKEAWNILIWLATLVTLAGGLAETRFVNWVGQALAPSFAGRSVSVSILLLVGAFFFLHYLFAGMTAHVSALLPVFLGVAVTVPGITPLGWGLLLCQSLGMMGILTAYATAPNAIYYGSGYIPNRDFWRLGLILGVIFFTVYLVIAVRWLGYLGI